MLVVTFINWFIYTNKHSENVQTRRFNFFTIKINDVINISILHYKYILNWKIFWIVQWIENNITKTLFLWHSSVLYLGVEWKTHQNLSCSVHPKWNKAPKKRWMQTIEYVSSSRFPLLFIHFFLNLWISSPVQRPYCAQLGGFKAPSPRN